jgi:hypothetical protein
MYFAFLWMDRWLKIMEAFTAEQERLAQSRSEDQIAPDEELVNLRSALTDRDHALLAALRHGKELETALARQRDAAEERGADYLREIAERTPVAEEAEERLKAELQKATRTQAEVTRLTEELLAVKEELAAAKRDVERSRGELKAAKSETERLASVLDKMQAEVKSTRDESERLAAEIAEAQVQAETARKDYDKRLAELHRELTQVERRAEADPEPVKLEERSKKPRGVRKAKTATPNVPQHPAAPEVAPKSETSVDGFVLHFQKPADWSERVFVYHWDTDPATERPEWPGIPLEDEGDGWRAHRFEGIRAANLIFTDDQGRQTGNLHRDRSGYLDADGVWHGERPKAGGGTASSPIVEAADVPSRS